MFNVSEKLHMGCSDEEACDWCNNAMEDSIWALFNVNITNEMALDASDELSEILINHGDAGIAEAGGAFDKASRNGLQS